MIQLDPKNQRADLLSHRYKILIAEDNRLVAELCKDLLAPEVDVVGIVNNGRDLISLALDLRPDLVVIDISIPILNGLCAGKRLKEILPNVKLVYLTMDPSEELAAEAVLLGASGYVLKPALLQNSSLRYGVPCEASFIYVPQCLKIKSTI